MEEKVLEVQVILLRSNFPLFENKFKLHDARGAVNVASSVSRCSIPSITHSSEAMKRLIKVVTILTAYGLKFPVPSVSW